MTPAIRTFRIFALAAVGLALVLSLAVPARAVTVPPAASAHGKYAHLIQVLPCPGDTARYGEFRDFGRWGGGAWCGQTGLAGHWVWANPNWYVWRDLSASGQPGAAAPPARNIPARASVNGKYADLIQVLHCPGDAARYGEFRDYGRWGGGAWCGQTGQAGHWVWVNPNWYVWRSKP